MLNVDWKGQKTGHASRWWAGILTTGLLLSSGSAGLAQEEGTMPAPVSPSTTSTSSINEPFFADVLVRGRPVFQVGSLANISAEQRTQIINRRISSLLARSEDVGQVSVSLNSQQNYATLQLNNRILMTVTQQDAQDFGLDLQGLANEWAQNLNRAFDRPPLAIDVIQRLNGTVRGFLRNAINNLPSFVGAMIVILLTWLVAKIVRRLFFTWAEKTEGDHSTEILIGRLGYGGVWILGWVIALGVLGLDFAALLGALGLTSVAIGFSLKDVLSNYIAGVILLAARPFRINDQIVIEEYEGTVTQIQLRATTLKTYDGRVVYIPNQEVFLSSITNNTASPRRRSSVMVGIDYQADVSIAKKVIHEAINNLDLVEPSPPPEVLVRELAASTVNLEVRFWVDSRRAEFLDMTSRVIQTIKEALETANIEMPSEIYTLVFRNALKAEKIQEQEN